MLDFGDDKVVLRTAQAINIEGLEPLLPICIGCEHIIEKGKLYYSNSSGALVSHPNGFCLESARKYLLSYYATRD